MRKFQGAKVPGSESSRVRKFHGANFPRSESSRERKFHTWNFRSRERMVLGLLERKVHNSRYWLPDSYTHKTVNRCVFLKLVPELFPGVIINPACALFSDTEILLAVSASKDTSWPDSGWLCGFCARGVNGCYLAN